MYCILNVDLQKKLYTRIMDTVPGDKGSITFLSAFNLIKQNTKSYL